VDNIPCRHMSKKASSSTSTAILYEYIIIENNNKVLKLNLKVEEQVEEAQTAIVGSTITF